MLHKYGMRIFYGFFMVLFIGMGILSSIDAENTPLEAVFDIERQTATAIDVSIDVRLGALAVHGGKVSVMHGQFEYENEQTDATVTYSEDDERGTLRILQRGQTITDVATNTFDITLTEAHPLVLDIVHGAGEALLDLHTLQLEALSISLGDGNNLVALGSQQPLFHTAGIETGSGADHVDIACDCEVLRLLRIDLSGGDDHVQLAGNYPILTSLDLDLDTGDDALLVSGTYEAISTLTVALGPGDDRLVMDGVYPNLQQFFIQVGTGNDIIDLSHEWDHSFEIDVVSQSNSTVLYLPQGVGVAVMVRDLNVEISTTNMRQDGELWVNETYTISDITLEIFVSTANVEQVELISGPPREPLIERNFTTTSSEAE